MNSSKLSVFIDRQKDNIVNDIIRLVRIPSISNNSKEVKRALYFVLDLAKEMGFDSKSVLDDQVGVIEIGEGDEILGILSHVDVVPPGNLKIWEIPPFEPKVKDGSIWGRGTLDDKGAIIACLYAIKAVESLGISYKKKIQLILGTQEEVEWVDMDTYVKKYKLPDYGFTPDGEFPVCNIEKGMADIELAIPVNQDIKGKLIIKSIKGGRASNIVPDECIAELNYEGKTIIIRAAGTSTHSCMPNRGDNAIVNMCKILKELNVVNNGFEKIANAVVEKFEDVYCSGVGLYSKEEYFNGEFIHRNAMSPTLISTQDSLVKININMRHAYGTEEKHIRSAFENVAKEIGGTIIQAKFKPPIYIDKEKPFMKVFADSYEKMSGFKNEFALAYGGSYAKAMPNIVSWGPLFPGEKDTCHEINEKINITSLMTMTKIFAEAISNIVLSDDSFK